MSGGQITTGLALARGAGRPDLGAARRRAERGRNVRALLLVAPLFLFLLLDFLLPIGGMLLRSVRDPELEAVLPDTAAGLRAWDGAGMPGPAVVATFGDELRAAGEAGTASSVANRLNYDVNGFRTLILRTASHLGPGEATIESLSRIDPRWAERGTWSAMRRATGPYTSFYVLAALDRRLTPDGEIQRTPGDRAIFVTVFERTFWVGLVVTLTCLVIAYPVAFVLATAPERVGNVLLILVLLPFWTAVLVRTAAWMVLLQREGIINAILQGLGLISDPLSLIYNRTGVYIAMTYVLLPYMILPIYGVMKGLPSLPVRAALSLGARPAVAFRRVYLPQTLPGIAAGCLLVFILAIGYYVTPALVGGAEDQMISYFIAFYTNQTLNWGMAAALALILLIATLLLYGVFARLVGAKNLSWR